MLLSFVISLSLMCNIGLSNVSSTPSNALGPLLSYKTYLANYASKLDLICSKDMYSCYIFWQHNCY